MDTIKVLAIDSMIERWDHPEIIRRYDHFRRTNGFMLQFVHDIKSAKANINYSRFHPGSDATYSLIAFSPAVRSIDKNDLQSLLESARQYFPVLMCAWGQEEHWKEEGFVKKIHYDDQFEKRLISVTLLGEFAALEKAMYSCIQNYRSQK